MIALVEGKRTEVAALCQRYRVRRLEVFGSAANDGDFDPARSDLDFLVDFEPTDALGPADQYFGLLDSLQQTFGRQVDLVSVRSMRNPYFIKSINATRQVLYAS